jgi:hypothetical protein
MPTQFDDLESTDSMAVNLKCRRMIRSMTLSFKVGWMTVFWAPYFNENVLWTESGHIQVHTLVCTVWQNDCMEHITSNNIIQHIPIICQCFPVHHFLFLLPAIHCYESKTNSGTRHQFWDQRVCNQNFLTPCLIWMLKNAPIVVVGLSSMLIYFSCPSDHWSLMQRCLLSRHWKVNTEKNNHIDLIFWEILTCNLNS